MAVFLVSLLVFICYLCCSGFFFFFKQKTAYEMRISDWSSDVCSSDLAPRRRGRHRHRDRRDDAADPCAARAPGAACTCDRRGRGAAGGGGGDRKSVV